MLSNLLTPFCFEGSSSYPNLIRSPAEQIGRHLEAAGVPEAAGQHSGSARAFLIKRGGSRGYQNIFVYNGLESLDALKERKGELGWPSVNSLKPVRSIRKTQKLRVTNKKRGACVPEGGGFLPARG